MTLYSRPKLAQDYPLFIRIFSIKAIKTICFYTPSTKHQIMGWIHSIDNNNTTFNSPSIPTNICSEVSTQIRFLHPFAATVLHSIDHELIVEWNVHDPLWLDQINPMKFWKDGSNRPCHIRGFRGSQVPRYDLRRFFKESYHLFFLDSSICRSF